MFREEKVIHHIHGYEDLLRFLHTQHPDILKEWNGPNHKATTGTQTDLAEGEDNAT
jgi:hypothetical protein